MPPPASRTLSHPRAIAGFFIGIILPRPAPIVLPSARESDAERLEEAQEQAGPRALVDPSQRPGDDPDQKCSQRLGRNGEGPLADERQIEERARTVERPVRQDLAGQVGARDPLAGVAEPVDDAPAVRRTEERDEAQRGADRPAPGVRELQVAQGGKVPDEAGPQLGVMPLGMIATRVDAVAAIISRLARAEEDSVVGGQPVVLEEGAGVADALAAPPADRRALLRRERIADQDVVVE